MKKVTNDIQKIRIRRESLPALSNLHIVLHYTAKYSPNSKRQNTQSVLSICNICRITQTLEKQLSYSNVKVNIDSDD